MLNLSSLTAVLETLLYAIQLSLFAFYYCFRICFYLVPRQLIPDRAIGRPKGVPGQYNEDEHLDIEVVNEAEEVDDNAHTGSSTALESRLENTGTLKPGPSTTPTLTASPTTQRAHEDTIPVGWARRGYESCLASWNRLLDAFELIYEGKIEEDIEEGDGDEDVVE